MGDDLTYENLEISFLVDEKLQIIKKFMIGWLVLVSHREEHSMQL